MPAKQLSIPDAAGRELALTTNASFIVQAPAGSGKTTLLANRYINLLATVERPEEILAITFTKKAAAEMRHRVLALLQADTDIAKQVRAHNDSRQWHLFDNPNVLKIQTIDSFALEVASQTPYLGSAAGLGITEQAGEFYSDAATKLLSRLYQEDASNTLIAEFLAFLDNDAGRAERLLATMLARRDQWLDAVTTIALNDVQATTAQMLQVAVGALSKDLTDQLDTALSTDDKIHLQQLAYIWGFDSNWHSAIPRLLTQAGTLRKRLTAKDGVDDAEIRRNANRWLEDLAERGLASLFLSFSRLPSMEHNDYERLQLCCVCLALAAAELDEQLRQAGLLDFTGLLIRAKQALRDEHGPTDLAMYLDYRISHVLIDEYQDTSRAQFEFFNLLTEAWQADDGNTFFAVGDPMQSIYRFRDADVAIFRDTREHGLNQLRLTPIVLQANFRSDPRVIDWCNTTFTDIFGQLGAHQLGEVEFSPATAMVEPQGSANVACYEFASDTDETQQVIRHIENLLEQNPDTTIAILCRARSHLSSLLSAFAENNIRIQATDMELLADKPIIADLMALHQVLLTPNDRLAWFSLLRSPVIGMTLEQLTTLDTIEDWPNQLELLNDTFPALLRLHNALSWAQNKLYEVPLREVIEGTWFRLGGVDAYAEAHWTYALAWFDLLDDLGRDAYRHEVLARALDVLFAASSHGARVQVMTVHKAKGLEFDHVVVPFLNRGAANDEAPLLMWRAPPQGLLMGVRGDAIHQWLTFEERERAKNEEKRLLYVACTRAKLTLHLSYTTKPGKKPQGLARWLQASAEQLPSHNIERSNQQAELSQGDLFRIPMLKRLPSTYAWQQPDYIELDNAQSQTSVLNDGADARREVALGILVHRALAWLTTPIGQKWMSSFASESMQTPNAASQALLQRLQFWRRELGLTQESHTKLEDTALQQTVSMINDDIGRWILAPHEQHEAEWPLTGLFEREVQNVIIDRSFKVDGQRWIIDYKTASPELDEPQSRFIQREVQLYSAQLHKYQTMVSALDPSPIRLGLYFTAITHLQELT